MPPICSWSREHSSQSNIPPASHYNGECGAPISRRLSFSRLPFPTTRRRPRAAAPPPPITVVCPRVFSFPADPRDSCDWAPRPIESAPIASFPPRNLFILLKWHRFRHVSRVRFSFTPSSLFLVSLWFFLRVLKFAKDYPIASCLWFLFSSK